VGAASCIYTAGTRRLGRRRPVVVRRRTFLSVLDVEGLGCQRASGSADREAGVERGRRIGIGVGVGGRRRSFSLHRQLAVRQRRRRGIPRFDRSEILGLGRFERINARSAPGRLGSRGRGRAGSVWPGAKAISNGQMYLSFKLHLIWIFVSGRRQKISYFLVIVCLRWKCS
jgi:hypothetical protein